MNPSGLVRTQLTLLEELFPRGWFESSPPTGHPALVRWQIARTVLKQGGTIRWPQQQKHLPLIARMLLDSVAFVTVTQGDLQSFRLGSLELFGDERVRRKIQSRIVDPKQFEDVMVELSIAAWHQGRGHQVAPLEQENMPDLRVEVGGTLPAYVECKRLWSGSAGRIAKSIQRANNQLKSVGEDRYGVAVLDVSVPANVGRVFGDDLPEPVEKVAEYARAALRGPKNRAVGRALLTWDDYMLFGEPPDRTMIAFRRRVLPLDHEEVAGVTPIPHGVALFEGYTAALSLLWDTSLCGVQELVVTDLGRQCQKAFEITDEDLIDAFACQDKSEHVVLADAGAFHLFARRVVVGEELSYLLSCAQRQGEALHIIYSFRLPPALSQAVELRTPMEMLAALAENYGLPVIIGERKAKFIASERIFLPYIPGEARLLTVENPRNHSCICCTMVRMSRIAQLAAVECAFVFCIDTDHLREDLGLPSS